MSCAIGFGDPTARPIGAETAADWPRLREHLLAEVSDLVAAPRLVPLAPLVNYLA